MNEPEKIQRGVYYPLADHVNGKDKNTFRAQWDGLNQRPPRAGEWYLSGAIIEAYQARADMTQPMHIAVLVEGELTWRPLGS